ncbi:MAG: hypothetical protein ACLGG0_15350, partial [Bacteriovoracia bacterium]
MIKLFFIALAIASFSGPALSSTSINLELGQASNAYNKVKIDGEEGTRFNLAPALDLTFYYRLGLVRKFNSPHGLRFLYAPLKFSGEKRFSKDIDFNGAFFPSGEKTETEYQFNSYRGTYFYEVFSSSNLLLR